MIGLPMIELPVIELPVIELTVGSLRIHAQKNPPLVPVRVPCCVPRLPILKYAKPPGAYKIRRLPIHTDSRSLRIFSEKPIAGDARYRRCYLLKGVLVATMHPQSQAWIPYKIVLLTVGSGVPAVFKPLDSVAFHGGFPVAISETHPFDLLLGQSSGAVLDFKATIR